MALATVAFGDIFSVSRTGDTATVVDSSGDITPVAGDLPRWDYDPITNNLIGLLREVTSENLFEFTNDVTKSDSGNGVTVTRYQDDFIDGSDTGTLMEAAAGPGTIESYVEYDLTASSTTFTVSAFFKANDTDSAYIRSIQSATDLGLAFANLTAGTVINVSGSGSPAAKITAFKDDWYRLELSVTCTAAAITVRFGVGDDGSASIDTADNPHSVYCTAIQAEDLPYATSYIPSTPLTQNDPDYYYFFQDDTVVGAPASVFTDPAYYNTEEIPTVRFTADIPAVGYDWPATIPNYVRFSNQYNRASNNGTVPDVDNNLVTFVDEAALGPDGTNTACEITDDNSDPGQTTLDTIYVQNQYEDWAGGSWVKASAYLKKTDSQYGFIALPADQNAWVMIDFDAVDPTIAARTNLYPGAAYSITDEGDGWFRLCVSSLKGAGQAMWAGPAGNISNTGGAIYLDAYADGTRGVLIFGFQVEAASSLADATPGDLVKTPYLYQIPGEILTSQNNTRNADTITLTDTGWLNPDSGTMIVGAKPLFAEQQIGLQVFSFSLAADPTDFYNLTFDGTSDTLTLTVTEDGDTEQDLDHTVTGYGGGQDEIRAGGVVAASDFLAGALGNSPTVGDTGAVPTIDTVQVGSGSFSGHLTYVKYYPCRASADDLQTDTEVA